MRNYQVLLADPPWLFGAWSKAGKGRTAEHHYRTMSIDDLVEMGLWVIDITAANSALFMWTTNSTIMEAGRVMEAWGYTYKTIAFAWLKLRKTWHVDPARIRLNDLPVVATEAYHHRGLHFGMGHYTRSQSEVCLLGIRGRMAVADKAVRQVIAAPVGRHSQKPSEQYPLIQRLYPDARRLELFARERAPGWDVWGAEAPDGLPELP